MSKSLGNVVNPDTVVAEYGADAFRLYEMFMGPFENAVAWSTSSIAGTARFVERVWQAQEMAAEEPAAALDPLLHETIKKVGEDIEAFKFNTAVSQMMIFLNALEKAGAIGKRQWRVFLRLLAPFAPHVAEELWSLVGGEGSIHRASWPDYDPALLAAETVTIGVQVDGKRRGEVALAPDAPEAEALEKATALPAVAKLLGGRAPARVVYRPGVILSLVS
jgi:leucyl-tRNA synthetase